jgi:hypothetical protein
MDESKEKLLRYEAGEISGDVFEKKTRTSTNPTVVIVLVLSLAINFMFILKNYSNPAIGSVSRSKYGIRHPQSNLHVF